MQFKNILICFFIFGLNSIYILDSSDPNGSEDSSKTSSEQDSRKSSSPSKRFSVFSTSQPKKPTIFSSSIASIPSVSSLGSSSSGPSIVLDFNASEISNDFEISTTIPGVLKYSAKPTATGNFNKIRGNDKELTFTKKINYVMCNSPFDNNITVVFEDGSSEEYYLEDDGFEKPKEEEVQQEESGSDKELTSKQDLTGIELDLLNPTDEFSFEEVGNIKCYKPKAEGNIISKVRIQNSLRLLEGDTLENFVCMFEESGSYRLMVAYRDSQNKWLKYTLSRVPSSPILMDVTLIRKFEAVVPETLFVDKSTPEDDMEFVYNNLVVNSNSTGMMKSKTKGNKVFILTVKTNGDTSSGVEHEIEFDQHFKIMEGFMFYAIRSKPDYSEMIFSYTNDNVLLHEKFVKKDGKFHRDNKTVYRHDISRTKKFLDLQFDQERVVFLKSLVADCIEQGLKLSHYGKFKVVDFEKSDVPTLVIFPNVEFYLNKDIEHRLILCENGRNVSFVMDTETKSKKTKYIFGTDPIKGNPFSMMALFGPEEEDN